MLAMVREPMMVLREDMTVLSASPSFYEHFRVTPEVTLGKSVYELGNGQWDIPALRTLLEHILPSGAVVADYEVQHDFEGLGPRVMLVNARSLDTGKENDSALFLAIEDVTERMARMRDLAAARDYAQSIVAMVREPMMVLREDMTVLSASPSFYEHFRVTPEVTLGKSVYELGNGQWDIPALRTLLEHILPSGAVVADYEVQHDFEGLGPRVMLVNARSLNTGKENDSWVFLAIEDVTAKRDNDLQVLKRLNAQLASSNKELNQFTYSVSHDLRAPLRAMDGFSQALLRDYAEGLDGQGRHYLNRIRAGAQRMGVRIESLLKLSRLSRQTLTREDFDLSEIVREVAELLTETTPDRQVEFAIPDQLCINGDVALLMVVLENLIQNSWKFTAGQPISQITVGSEIHNGIKAYFVRDNGVGFDMKYADKLFTAFQRLHSPREFDGMGVGLATVQRIVHRHGGEVWAHSEIGQGATFLFTTCNAKGQT